MFCVYYFSLVPYESHYQQHYLHKESVGIENGGPLIAPPLIGNEAAYAVVFTEKNMH